MWGERERSPVLAAPGSNNYSGLIASSTNAKSGSEGSSFQGLSIEEANNLCQRYLPLAYKTAGRYRDRGVDLDDLQSAGLTGLVLASRRYDPSRSSFGSYAKYSIKGQITELFKRKAAERTEELDAPLPNEDGARLTLADKLAYTAPVGVVDMRELSEPDREIIKARDAGETLTEIGRAHGLSPERIRQREAQARKRTKGAVASICISDLTHRGDVLPFPARYSWGPADFRDRPPPKHVYCEPQPSKELAHHRRNAVRLAALRGEPSIFDWGRK